MGGPKEPSEGGLRSSKFLFSKSFRGGNSTGLCLSWGECEEEMSKKKRGGNKRIIVRGKRSFKKIGGGGTKGYLFGKNPIGEEKCS